MDYIKLIETTGLDLAITLQFTNEEIMMLARGRSILTAEEKQIPSFLQNHIIGINGEEGKVLKIGLFENGTFVKWINENYMKMLAHGYPVTYVDNVVIEVE